MSEILCGIAIGVGATLFICNLLAWHDHREWCAIVDRAMQRINELEKRKDER